MTPKKIAAFAIGPVGGAFLSLASIPIITWYFSQEDVGRMALFQVTLSFGVLLLTLGLDQSYVREFHSSENKPALLKNAILPGGILLLFISSIIFFFGEVFSKWLFGISQPSLSLLVIVALIASFVSRFLSLVLRMNERGFAYSMSQLLPKIILLAIIGGYVALNADKNLTNLIVANTVAIAFVSFIYSWNTRREWIDAIGCKADIHHLKAMFRFGLPLILGGVAFWGLSAADKVFLRALSSFEELGIYAVAVSFAGAATILQSVFSTIWAPLVYKWAEDGAELDGVYQISRYILALVIAGFSLAGLFSWVVTLFLPPSYAAVQWILVSCMGYPLLYTLSETTVVGIGITRRSGFSMLAAIIAFVVSLLGNWLLIPSYGAAGAAASTCVAFWVFFILRTEFSIYVWRPIPRTLFYSYTTIVVGAAVVFSLWGAMLGHWMLVLWAGLLASCFFVFQTELQKAGRFLLKHFR